MAYTPDDLYNLAAQAGIAPTRNQARAGDIGDDGNTYVEPPRPDGATYDLHGEPSQYPGIMQGGLEPPTSNIPGSPASPVGGSSTSVGTKTMKGEGYSVGVGGKAYNADTNQKLDAKDKVMKARVDAAHQESADAYEPITDELALARVEGKDAAVAKTEAELKKVDEQSATARYMGKLAQDLQNNEIAIHANEAARINQRITQYETSMADFAASKVDPQQFWHNQSGGMRFGTLVTAFVHDFLGAKGIKTSAMQTLNTAVQRNIDAQIQNINNKGEVAKGFKNMYEMELSRSSSAAEARKRITGYMLEAAKQHVTEHFSTYESMLATAQGKEALAAIDKEFAKNHLAVIKDIQDDSRARSGQLYDWEKKKMEISMEGYKANISARNTNLEERKFAAAQTAAANKANQEMLGGRVVDPATGLEKWQLRPDRSDAEKKDVRNAVAGVAEVDRAMTDLRDLAREMGGGKLRDDFGVSRLSDVQSKKYDAIRYRLAHAAVKANNERATEADVQQYLKGMPIPTELNVGGVEEILSHTQKTYLNKAQDILQQNTYDIPKDQWKKTGAENMINEKSQLDAKAGEATAKRGGVQKDTTQIAYEAIGAPDGHKGASDSLLAKTKIDRVDAQLAWSAAVDKDSRIAGGNQRDINWNTQGASTGKAKAGDVPAWAVGIQSIAQAAQGGDEAAQKKLISWATKPGAISSSEDPLLKDYNGDDLTRIRLLSQYYVSNMKGGKQKIKDAEDAPAYDSSGPSVFSNQNTLR